MRTRLVRFMRPLTSVIFVVSLLFVAIAIPSLQAQNQPASVEQQAQPAPERKQPETDQKPLNPGIGRQLAHETREAAGEEKDETAEFKQSASVRLVSRLTGLNLQQSYWLCVFLNFAVIAGVLVWAGR